MRRLSGQRRILTVVLRGTFIQWSGASLEAAQEEEEVVTVRQQGGAVG